MFDLFSHLGILEAPVQVSVIHWPSFPGYTGCHGDLAVPLVSRSCLQDDLARIRQAGKKRSSQKEEEEEEAEEGGVDSGCEEDKLWEAMESVSEEQEKRTPTMSEFHCCLQCVNMIVAKHTYSACINIVQAMN